MVDCKLCDMALATEDHDRWIRFGRFTFDFASNRLLKSGREVPIQDQPATLLAILIRRPGDLVTREELQARLWPDKQFLEFDAALNTTVKKLRQVLKDDAGAPQFIQTVPKKGYRFIGELQREPRPLEGSPDSRKMKVIPISPETAAAAQLAIEPEAVPAVVKAPTFWARHWVAISVSGMALIVVCLTLLILARQRPLPELVERQLTSNSMEDAIIDSALSPDGKFLAYANWRHVMILNLAERVTHTLPNLDRLHVFHTTWTHDSTRLLVVGYERPGAITSLWQVSILGNEEPQKVADNVYAARQSPDGKYLAFISADLSELSYGLSDTGERIRLYSGTRIFSPAWSYDNRRIWFLEDLENDWRTLRSAPLNGKDPAGAVQKIAFITSILLLPDSRMAYAGRDGIYSIKADSSLGRTVGEPVLRLKAATTIRLSATSDGTKLAYQKGASEADVFVGDLSNGNMRLSSTHRLTLDDASDYPHAWTKDSLNVIFESDRSGAWTFYSQAFDGPDPKMLISSEANSVKPVLTPDGGSLLYVSIPHNSDQNEHLAGVKIMRVPVSGGTPAEVFAFQHPTSFHCPQANGKLCVMQERIGSSYVYSYLDPVRGKQGPFRPPEQMPNELDWDLSPDGSSVAVLPSQGDDNRVWIFRGSEPKREIAVTDATQLRSVNWWPDGKGFFMASFGDGKPLLMTVPLSGHASVLSGEILSVPSWAVPSPDGKHLAFVCHPNSYKAFMVDGF